MGRSAIGLDIGTSSVHVVELTRVRGKLVTKNFGGLQLRNGCIKAGEILDPAEVAGAIREVLANTGIRGRDVVVGMANQRVIVREIDLPWQPVHELRQGISFQVQEHLPISVEDAQLDFHVIEEFTNAEGDRMVRILLVAAQREAVDAMLGVLARARVQPVKLDLNSFAVLRALQDESRFAEEATEVIVDIGAGQTNMVVHQNGQPKFVRLLAMGGDQITHRIAEELELTFEEAEKLKHDTGIGNRNGTDLERLVADEADTFIREIRGSLDFFFSRRSVTRIDRLLVTGGGSMMDGVSTGISDVLRVPLAKTGVFSRIPAASSVFTPEQLETIEPVLVTAFGLALGANP